MILKATTMEEIGETRVGRRKSKELKALIEEFIESGSKVSEVFNESDYNNNNDMRNCISRYLISNRINTIECFMTNGRVFLYRVDLGF